MFSHEKESSDPWPEPARWPPLAKPQIFLSSSDRADPEVMAVIEDVLEQFRDRIRVHYWKESAADGNISVQTIAQIHESQFGVCYLSEPDHDSGELRFVDNRNVLFEAGMMQARAYGWIPIREAASHRAPFNFAQKRMVIVERKDGNVLKTDKLRSDLVSQLTQMIVP